MCLKHKGSGHKTKPFLIEPCGSFSLPILAFLENLASIGVNDGHFGHWGSIIKLFWRKIMCPEAFLLPKLQTFLFDNVKMAIFQNFQK